MSEPDLHDVDHDPEPPPASVDLVARLARNDKLRPAASLCPLVFDSLPGLASHPTRLVVFASSELCIVVLATSHSEERDLRVVVTSDRPFTASVRRPGGITFDLERQRDGAHGCRVPAGPSSILVVERSTPRRTHVSDWVLL